MVNLRRTKSQFLSLFSTVTLLDAPCYAFHNEIPKWKFVYGSEKLGRTRRTIVLLSSASDERSTTTTSSPLSGGDEAPRRPLTRRQPEGRSRSTQQPQRRQARPIRTTSNPIIPFDGKILSSEQTSNEQAPPFDLFANLENDKSRIRCMSDFSHGQTLIKGIVIASQPAFEFFSLDDLTFSNHHRSGGAYKLPGFSKRFNNDATFRRQLRQAMREDIYDTTAQYQNLSPKAKEMLLLPDSSLQGSWRKPPYIPDDEIRMKRLTKVLYEAFIGATTSDNNEEDRLCCPTGDDLMHAIGNLCGPEPSTHYIDIVGVLDRTIPHSWHQDTGRSGSSSLNNNSKTVLWGFPMDNDYTGCGVFSHVVSLQHESKAPTCHPKMQPILFDGTIDNQYIVRPSYGPGREILMYRDVDVLHSSPDVAYRTSVMRFM